MEIGLEIGGRMGTKSRFKTPYPGVFYRISARIGRRGEEKVYYIVFKKNGKVHEEKVGRQFSDNMTPAKAAGIRAERIEGKRLSRKAIREAEKAAKASKELSHTINHLWKIYLAVSLGHKDTKADISRYNLYIEPKFGNVVPSDICTLDVDRYRQHLLGLGKSPQTVKHILGLLRRLIKFGVKKGLCPSIDPAKLYFEMPRVDNQKTETLNEMQLQNYYKALDQEENQDAVALLRLALATGMRKGALLGLKWEDCDFANQVIILQGTNAKNGITLYIPMNEAAKLILSQITRTDSPYVFPGKDGGKRKDFRRIARRVKINAGLPEDFRPLHGLRHHFASFLASSGQVDIYTLQKLLTHSSPQMTQRYAHLADTALKRASNIATKMLNFETHGDE